ncbi:TonB-dependent receptor [Derxia gummosa]|uniref:TonB-dependent receptor n=1 Tax=Derxia gummosa DSM 723 TaxID=1121388 RepID=A0A8B6X9G2_9BURK|nr:TonB-dependent receptor [Derxia gummosa]
MTSLRPLTLGVTLALTGSLLSLALPVAAQTATATLDRVEVTGSAIRRVQAEGPAPVTILRRAAIEKTGATSLNELIQSIAALDIYDQGELTSNSPAGSGVSSFRMRGLDDTNLLVLLNGRRLPVNALYDSSGAGASADINMIPIAIVERVEILKDGASAIYGADAITGVINIITRSSYNGAEVYTSQGISSRGDGQEQRYGIVGGFGDLAEDHWNIIGTIDYFNRDPILRKDRALTRSSDFRRYGGPDTRSGFTGYGNYVDPATGEYTGSSVRPCPADQYNEYCRYDVNASTLTAYNGADRLNTMLLGTLNARDITYTGQFLYSQAKDRFAGHPALDWFPLDPDGNSVAAIRVMPAGDRITDRKSVLSSGNLGASGFFGEHEWKVDVGRSSSRITNRDSNYLDASLYDASANGLIDLTDPNLPQSALAPYRVTPRRDGFSTTTYVNTLLRGELLPLPAGALGYAVGAQYRRETLTDRPDGLTQQGLVVGSIQQAAVSAAQSVKSVFAELSVPLARGLESQLALRRDEYSNYSSNSPKFALKYEATPELAFRASAARSFKAPALKQLYGTQDQGALDITDPEQCQLLGLGSSCNVSGFLVGGSNPDLRPEKGKSYDLGVLYEPSPLFSSSVDFWWIYKTNEINTPTTAQALRAGLFGYDATGRLLVYSNLQNYQQRAVNGVDIDLRGKLPVPGLGQFSWSNAYTYTASNRIRRNDGTVDELADTYAYPKYRNVATVGFERNAASVQTAVRTIGGFWDTDEPHPIATDTHRVAPYTEVDLTSRYAGFKDVTLDLGVRNVFDRQPPISFTNAASGLYSQMGFAELYSVRGRFFYGRVSYRFM